MGREYMEVGVILAGKGTGRNRGTVPQETAGIPLSWEQLWEMGSFEGVREMDHWEVGRRHLGGRGETVLGQWGRGRPDRGAGASQDEWEPGAAGQPQAAWRPPTEPLAARPWPRSRAWPARVGAG